MVTSVTGWRTIVGGIGRRDIVRALVVGAVSVAFQVIVQAGRGQLNDPPLPIVFGGTVLVATPLLWSRTRPLLVAAVLSLLAVLESLWGAALSLTPLSPGSDGGGPIGATILFALPLIVYTVARRRPPWATAVSLVVLTAPTGLIVVRESDQPEQVVLAVPILLLITTVVLSPLWIVGMVRRRVALGAARLAEQRHLLQAQALAEERGRIARELQSLVLADLTRSAERAERTGPDDDIRDGLLTITATGRDTLTAMRRLLGMLRGAGLDGSVPEPQPTVARLDELVAGFRDRGLDVRLTVSGQPRPLPDEVDLATYRLVRETLTRAGRAAPVVLTLAYETGAVRLTADGDLRDAGGAAAREWVRLVGGELRRGRGDLPALDVRLPERRKGVTWPSVS